MKAHRIALAIVVAAVAVGSTAQAQQTAEELYQAGLYHEEVQGNLESAIDVYRQILEDFSDNRAIGAKALLHIGLCYEKLGLREAQQAYQGVISNYPEAAQEVAVARQRLASLTRALEELEQKPRLRKIRIASNPDNGVLSPDGNKLAFVSEGSVWVVPVQGNVAPDMAGEPVRLTEPMGAWDSGNMLGWSGDSEWVAFSATTNDVEAIYVVAVDGSELKRIRGNHARAGHAYNFRLSLSADGKVLAYVYAEPDRDESPVCGYLDGLSVYAVPVDGGEASPLTGNCSREPAFSPDGRYLAYIKVKDVDTDDPDQRDSYKQLWAVQGTGGTPVLLVDSTQVRSPVWSPDGKMIAVIYEPGGGNESREVWVHPFSTQGGPVQPLARIELPRTTVSLLAGWTQNDELGVHLVAPEHRALYTVPATGGKAVQVTDDGPAIFPRWSPDGRTIVFRDSAGLAAVPAEGGAVRPIALDGDSRVNPGIPPGGGVHVSPDGKTVVFAGIRPGSNGYEQDIWTAPIEGGEPTRLTFSSKADRFPCWSSDGRTVAFLSYELQGKGDYPISIYTVPAQGGQSVPLTSETDSVEWASIAYSPDGKWLAYFSNGGQLKIIPETGGTARVVTEVDGAGRHTDIAWSPDGGRIAYTSRGSIWVVKVDGGAPLEVKTGLRGDTRVLHIGWSPDGEKIVFAGGYGGNAELWLISDFLPEER
jgi:Tol biopolymer transport system component